eukprot:CAMPEP_0206580298 /NCGR_PEP_ID=MMETSP0325_2-20121206/33065_1 /ASSEMBLY_ACC=CAM_ASM_000347 /TAXON_ID=2866 /ORGANISM="Crypthecodinium cohnii, Strain Seligo" /LENGTH=326 /DNA_ID=CAMNT_0054086281 /DNA_START=20 /DNA_END=1000 /DNA_ORIENTATION=+
MSRNRKTGMGCYGACPMEPWGLYKSHQEFEEKLLKTWKAPFTGNLHDAVLAPYRLPQAGDVVAIENLSNRSEYNGVRAVVREGVIDADGRLLVDLIPSNAYQNIGSSTLGSFSATSSSRDLHRKTFSNSNGFNTSSPGLGNVGAAPSALGATLSAAVAHVAAAGPPPASSSSRSPAPRLNTQQQTQTQQQAKTQKALSTSLGSLDLLGLSSGPMVDRPKKLRVAASKLRPLPQVLGSDAGHMAKTMSMSASAPQLLQRTTGLEQGGSPVQQHFPVHHQKGVARSGGGPLRFEEPYISGYLNAGQLKFPNWGCEPIKQKGPKKKKKR